VQELVSKKDQPLLRHTPTKFEPHLGFVPAAAFAAAFKRSNMFAWTRSRLDKPFIKSYSHPAALMKSQYGVPGYDHVKALMWREQILLTRNKEGQLYRYIQMFVLAFMVSTLWLRGEVTNTDDVRVSQFHAPFRSPSSCMAVFTVTRIHFTWNTYMAGCVVQL
jgi:hypothetical protein